MNSLPARRPTVSLAMLFYNEEACVRSVVERMGEALSGAGTDFQLLPVDNGSRDRTSEIIASLAAADLRIKPVTVPENLGYGWGVINGLRAADGEWIGYMDGDGQIEPEAFLRLVRFRDAGYDMVKIRRALRQDGWLRGAVSDVYVLMLCLLFNLPFYDVNAKPRLFKREWLEELALSSRDWFLDAEMLIKARTLGMTVGEIKAVFLKRSQGASNVRPATAWEFLRNIARWRWGGYLTRWQKMTGLK